MNHQEFVKYRIWKWYNEWFWFQCVAGAKIYVKEVYWINLKSFSWSALNWFLTWSPFVWLPFKKVLNTPTWVPKVWDIVFFDKMSYNPYWHVAIVDEWTTPTILNVIEQNTGKSGKVWNKKAWDGIWEDDMFWLNTYNYKTPKVLWWYTKI